MPEDLEPQREKVRDIAETPASERQRLQDTALELARWQGRTDAHVAENSRRLDGINGSIEHIEAMVGAMQVEVSVVRTKIAVWAGIGSLIGAGVVSVIVTAGLGH